MVSIHKSFINDSLWLRVIIMQYHVTTTPRRKRLCIRLSLKKRGDPLHYGLNWNDYPSRRDDYFTQPVAVGESEEKALL